MPRRIGALKDEQSVLAEFSVAHHPIRRKTLSGEIACQRRRDGCELALRHLRRQRRAPENIDLNKRLRLVAEDIADLRSEEHTSELQSLMRISYAVFCLKKKKTLQTQQRTNST